MLLVLRHGESEWNRSPKRCQGRIDVPLSEAGREAARRAAAELAMPDAAYASPLARAQETARILLEVVAERTRRPAPQIVLDVRLAEADCGTWEGLLLREIEERWPAEWQALCRDDPSFAFPAGESLGQVRQRFAEAMAELDARHRDETALVVAHGGPMRFFLAESTGLPVRPGGPPLNLEGFRLDRGRILR